MEEPKTSFPIAAAADLGQSAGRGKGSVWAECTPLLFFVFRLLLPGLCMQGSLDVCF